MNRIQAAVCVVSSVLLHGACLAAEPVWVEGESATAVSGADVKPGSSRPGILSAGQWMTFSTDEDNTPTDGVTLAYDVNVQSAGKYVLWARVGFEWVRADLAFRVDGGAWQEMPADHATTNVVELAVWSELAWDQGPVLDLSAGQHKLEVRFTRPEKNDRFIFGLDCIALIPEGLQWTPDNTLKPGETYNADVDQQAAKVIHAVPASSAEARIEVPLSELWQVARFDDPNMDAAPYKPTKELPEKQLHWRGIKVPADAWTERPELSFGHRVAYRTRVDVPSDLDGRSFLLHFGGHAWITSVFVNGQFVEGRQSTMVPMDFDITRAIKPGQTNTIEVVIKGAYYAIDHQPGQLNRSRNQPRTEQFLKYFKWIDCTYPTGKIGGEAIQTGLTRPATLIVAGPAYTSDAFVRTSVKDMRLDADVEVTNPQGQAMEVTLKTEAVNDRTGEVEKTFAPRTLSIPAGGKASAAIGDKWADAKLWWPSESIKDMPTCYQLRTTLLVDGKPVDVRNTLFGFRELAVDGRHVTINGIRWRPHMWNAWGPTGSAAALDEYFRWNNRGMRMNALDTEVFDRSGIPGRMSSAWEGMFGNVALENPRMWENWKLHIAQQVKAHRNSPSIWNWEVGNEVGMITGRLFFGDKIAKHEKQMAEVVEVARQLDPTRLAVESGAGDFGGLNEVNSWHYMTGEFRTPREFYEYNIGAVSQKREGDMQTLYRWDGNRPQIQGEEFYFPGMGNFAWFGGPKVYRGKQFRDAAGGKYGRIYTEGGRWQDVYMLNPCTGPLPTIEKSMAAQAVFIREYNSAFYPEATVTRTIKVFNDTRSNATLDFRWRVEFNGNVADQGQKSYELKAGLNQEDTITVRMPSVQERTDGKLILELFNGETRVFEDSRAIAVLPAAAPAALSAETLAVFDPQGKVVGWLQQRKAPMAAIDDLGAIPAGAKTLLVGPGAITAENHQSVAAALRQFVSAGNTAIVLEQANPLREADLPVAGILLAGKEKGKAARPEWEKVGGHTGAIAHPMALAHPVLNGLSPDDFFTWAGADQLNYRLSYATPPSGSVNLIQAGEDLSLAPMFELLVGRGSYLLSQLLVGDKLGSDPVADRLLTNALSWAAARANATATRTVVVAGDPAFAAYVDGLGIAQEKSPDVKAALALDANVLVVSATPANLRALLDNAPAVQAMAERGGWIMLAGLDEAGLAAFSKLVGIQHRIRPFRKESALIDAMDDALTMGISDRDVQQIDPEVIMPWTGTHRVSGKLFSNVVDASDEIASFAKVGSLKEGSDLPLTDGLTAQTFWRYTQYLSADGGEQVTLELDRPDTIKAIELWQSDAYIWAKDIEVLLDGTAVTQFTLKDQIGWQTIELPPTQAKQIAIKLLSTYPPAKEVSNQLVTFDELRIRRELPADHAKRVIPLTTPCGIVKYPIGKGGVLLNQVRYDGDDLPENLAKKKLLFSALLRNLGSTFSQ
ncbi:MAG TPA: hypothetical protein VGN72_20270 [Tepidisphaeraceae bacterium]|jgi:beta-galactosidase|nr:hypothetical protein [Tepidisphaeraceae bacterium]